MTDSLISPACCEVYLPSQRIAKYKLSLNTDKQSGGGQALTKYYTLIVFLSWAQEICFFLRLMLFPMSPSPTIMISSLSLGGKHLSMGGDCNDKAVCPGAHVWGRGGPCLHQVHESL